MIPSEKVRERLDELIRQSRDDDYASISTLIGKNASYIQQFIARGTPRRLKEEDRHIIARHFDVPEWQLGGPLEKSPRGLKRKGFSEGDAAGITMIPAYDVSASAGFGAFVDREWADDYIPFQSNFLSALTRTPTEGLSVIKVIGDSMSPTLDDGDQILVDTNETAPGHEGVYVIRADDVLNVKRVSINPGNSLLTIKSDNPLYDTWSDVDPKTIKVIGKVLWAGRKL